MINTPFFFAIPFRSKLASEDWERSQRHLQATLRSMFAQTDPNFQVLLACHDVPDLPELSDPRVTVLIATTPPPADFAMQMKDKGRKRKMMSVELGRRGGGYFMLTDADDLVSRNLVAHVRAIRSEHGYLINRGYIYNAGTGTCRLSRSFHINRGTSAVLRFDPDDLPRSIDDTDPRLVGEYKMHPTFEEDAHRIGRPLDIVPFPAAMYNIGARGEPFAPWRQGDDAGESQKSG